MGFDQLCERDSTLGLEVPIDGISPHYNCECNIRQLAQELFSPSICALGPRREVAALTFPGITKTHWNDGELFFIVEDVAVDAEPISESITAWIVKWDPGLVDCGTRCLADDQNLRVRMSLKNRAWTEW